MHARKKTANIMSAIAFDERLLASGTCLSRTLGPGCEVLHSASLVLAVCRKHQRHGHLPRRDACAEEDGSVRLGVAAGNWRLEMPYTFTYEPMPALTAHCDVVVGMGSNDAKTTGFSL